MKLVIQRVNYASVEVEGKIISNIKKGLLIFLGISQTDTEEQIPWLAKKVVDLRIFEDDHGKMNLSLKEISGEILVVSQFTLYADCQRGRRPDFNNAAKPQKAEILYNKFIRELEHNGITPKAGKFGAFMKIDLENSGPVTIILER